MKLADAIEAIRAGSNPADVVVQLMESSKRKRRGNKKYMAGMGDNINGLRSSVGMGYGSGNATLATDLAWQEG